MQQLGGCNGRHVATVQQCNYAVVRRCDDAFRKQPRPPALGAHAAVSCSAARCNVCLPQVWTSMKTLNGREFCFMLNTLIRDDATLTDEVADQVPAGGG